MRCTITLAHSTGVQVAMLVEDLAQVDEVIARLLTRGYLPLSSPAGATSSAAPQPLAAEQPVPRPRGCEHLPVPPNELQQHWLARFPDEAVRDAWFQVGKTRLRRKKGGALIGDNVPCVIAEALQAYDEYVRELVRLGRQVNGQALWPPKREEEGLS